jgi:hypothetical protein
LSLGKTSATFPATVQFCVTKIVKSGYVHSSSLFTAPECVTQTVT